MNFSATIRHNGEVSIIDLTGQLTSFASGALRNTIADLIRQGRKKIVLNVGHLVYLDSSGVGELANCYMSVVKQSGEMKVVGLTAKVEEILKITQLYRVFQEFQNEEAALSSFPDTNKKRRSSVVDHRSLPRPTETPQRIESAVRRSAENISKNAF